DLAISGRRAAGPTPVSSNVYPSGGALATKRLATTPPPPDLVSTTTGWPMAADKSLASERPTKAIIEPDAKDISSVTGRCGQSSAAAGRGAPVGIAATASRTKALARQRLSRISGTRIGTPPPD